MRAATDSEQPTLLGLSPGTLILAATAAAFAFSSVSQLPAALASLGIGLGLAAAAMRFAGKGSLPFMLRRLAIANLFIAFLWLTVPWSVPGTPILSLGPLHLTQEGLFLAGMVTLKCNAILLTFLALTSGLSLPVIGCALERLRVPARLVYLFLFTCRYIHVIKTEWQKLQTAAALRGFVPRTSLHAYRTIANHLGLTVIHSMDRAARIYEAMLLRGFDGKFLTVTPLRTRHRDGLFLALFLLTLFGLLLADRT